MAPHTFTALSAIDLATIRGGDLDQATRDLQWWGNVIDKGAAAAASLSGKGFVYGGVIGGGAALAGGATIPAAGLAAWAGAATGAKVGFGIGFAYGAGREAYRTWHR